MCTFAESFVKIYPYPHCILYSSRWWNEIIFGYV